MNLEDLDKKYILSTYNKNYVNFITGKGSTLFNDDGVKFIDFSSGIGVNSVGHNNKKLTDALSEQINKIIHISNLQVIEPQVKLADKILKLAKYDGKVFFSNSGAEANEGAIKIARKYGSQNFDNIKYEIITLKNSFHGRTLATLKATGQTIMHKDYFAPYPDGFIYADDLDDIYNKINIKTVAVMIELIKGEGGVEALAIKEVQKLSNFLENKNILLIVDEVQTGVYRTGEFLASNIYNIAPDIITLAKGLGGGVPIGAILTKHKEIFQFGDHGSTFGGNYLSSTAGLIVLEILSDLKSSNELQNTINYFQNKLRSILKDNSKIFDEIVGYGLILGLKLKNHNLLNKIYEESFNENIIILKSGNNIIRFMPSLNISESEINEGFNRFNKLLLKIK